MNFMDLFVPMTAAFVAASIIMEVLNFLLHLWVTRRSLKRVNDAVAELVAGGADPQMAEMMVMQMMQGGGAPPGGFEMQPGMNPEMFTTASGNVQAHGQYL
jgi:hypothetical protein